MRPRRSEPDMLSALASTSAAGVYNSGTKRDQEGSVARGTILRFARNLMAWLFAACFLCSTSAIAQQQQAKRPAPKYPFMGSALDWKIDEVLEYYIRAISRYYNLTPADR